jgi:ABC-type sulfate/molybdate transport systems ATPase subunit
MTAIPAALVLEDVRLELSARPLLGRVLTVQPGDRDIWRPRLQEVSRGYICAWIRDRRQRPHASMTWTHLPPELRGIGILFQDDLLFPHMTVGENMAFALPRDSGARGNRQQLIDSALEECGLTGFAPRDPATLSGGQRARVALLRTLLSAGALLTAFNKLTGCAPFQGGVRPCRGRSLPTLLVTHDPLPGLAASFLAGRAEND